MVTDVRTPNKVIMIHHLKTIQPYFDQLYLGLKTFELRKNDRNYQVGDLLVLQEYDIDTGNLTGCQVEKVISHVLENAEQFGLMEGYCVLSITNYKPRL